MGVDPRKSAQAQRQERGQPGNPGQFKAMHRPAAARPALAVKEPAAPPAQKSKRKPRGGGKSRAQGRERAQVKHSEVMSELRDGILAAIETGKATGAWTQNWAVDAPEQQPANPMSSHAYTSRNYWLLKLAQQKLLYPTARWGTYKQWSGADCQVRKGERGLTVFVPMMGRCCKDPDCHKGSVCGGKPRMFWTTATVFNAAQVDGEAPEHPSDSDEYHRKLRTKWDSLDGDDVQQVRAAGEELAGRVGANVVFGDVTEAKFTWNKEDPTVDQVTMPDPRYFRTADAFLSTLAHELIHWSGHSKRLNRGSLQASGTGAENRDEEYAAEELVAELGAVRLCQKLGLRHQPREQHEKYLTHYAAKLRGRNGPSELERAITQAEKAAAYVAERWQAAEAGGSAKPEPQLAAAV